MRRSGRTVADLVRAVIAILTDRRGRRYLRWTHQWGSHLVRDEAGFR